MSAFDGAEVLLPLLATTAGSVGARGGTQDFGFHQGVVETWSPASGANSIRVHGSLLNDLPVLASGIETAFAPGDVVGILRYRTTYFVLGRISAPGAAASRAFEYAVASASSFAVTNTFTDLVEVNLAVPMWASRAFITCCLSGTVRNTGAGLDNVSIGLGIDGFTSGAHPQAVESTYLQNVHQAKTIAIACTPGGTVRCHAFAVAGASWPASGNNFLHLEASAVFASG